MPDAPATDRVGFVGLGRMGAPMVRRLAAGGVTVRGHDAASGVAEGLADVLAPVPRAAAAAEGSPVVILMLPDSGVVEKVVDGGLLDALAPGALLVDMSTSEPLRTRALAERVAGCGATLVDAPVSGGVAGAEAGTLTIMVGGPGDAVERLRPLLALMGRVRHVGGTGAGHAVKALNNLLSASHLLATSEAILAGERFGLNPTTMLDAINGSSGRSGSTETKWPTHIVPGTYASGFTAGLMVKDLRIALGLAEAVDAPRGHAARTLALWSRAIDTLGPGADHTEIARWLRERPEEDQ
ncbi:NAD(P)-dependent oxidoreductase [Pseudonocardia lutea]|uniref:NAD(P)-dependent oxidoreductase n=1 Tax=Pseudonocardia lutea TaxID=2172015 RepID=A0ABW1IIG3_9PSEU